MPHLHLSLQAGDDLILKRMKRRHLRDDAIAFCEDGPRALRPDVVFGADLIAGFPTETEAMFENIAAAGRGMRPDLAARLPLQRPRGHAGGAHAAVAGPAIRERAGRLRALRRSRVRRRISRRCRARSVDLLMETPSARPDRGLCRAREARRATAARRDRRGAHRRPAGRNPSKPHAA